MTERRRLLLSLLLGSLSGVGQCAGVCDVATEERLDCWPEQTRPVDQASCNDRGCCWTAVSAGGPPPCFYGLNATQFGYVMETASLSSDRGNQYVDAQLTAAYPHVPDQIAELHFDAFYETDTRLRLKIYDARTERYQVPQYLVPRPVDGLHDNATSPSYSVQFASEGQFGVTITRDTGEMLLSAVGLNFIFADQFLQMTWQVPDRRLYGLGEHRAPLMYDLGEWRRVGMWTHDQPPEPDDNLYASYPMYVMINDQGIAHGVVLLNSNAMDVTLQPMPAVTWRTIGGIFDFYVLTGPTPAQVMEQFFQLLGAPRMPPYWGLGYHLCRWGYTTANQTWDVVRRLRALEFPQEVQWNDIDYMDSYLDFTYDPVNYDTLPQMVADLHAHKQRYIMIVEPGVSDDVPNKALETGNEMHVWVNRSDGVTPIEGQVWPGNTYFPDFTAESSLAWWEQNLARFHQQIPFDGVWIDMNEPTSEVAGSTARPACTDDKYDNPPYTPHIVDSSLISKTLCGSAVQAAGRHYDVHNMYGHSEGIATRRALDHIFRGNRSIVLSRSTYFSSGRHVAHWTGDNHSSFKDIHWSIAAVLNTNMFGISMTGADLCGFINDTTEELCTRWQAMGAFYTFVRNHNTEDAIPQDPSVFSPKARGIMKKYILLRYSYLPYLYTQLFLASTQGRTVLGSLAFHFPHDILRTGPIDDQFVWGPHVMVAPVYRQGVSSRSVYFPAGSLWYDLETLELVSGGGETLNVSAPIDKVPLYGRGSSIVVRQTPELYLTDARQNPFSLVVFVGPNPGNGSGSLFWDDGESPTMQTGAFNFVDFYYELTWGIYGSLVGRPRRTEYGAMPVLENITFAGFLQEPEFVTLDGELFKYQFDPQTSVLTLLGVNLDLTRHFHIDWF